MGWAKIASSRTAVLHADDHRLFWVKTCHNTRCAGTKWERWELFLILISALDGGEWLASRPGRALPPGKVPPVPIG